MGNTVSPSTGTILATGAMAKYLSVRKEQVLIIRDELLRYSDSLPTNTTNDSVPLIPPNVHHYRSRSATPPNNNNTNTTPVEYAAAVALSPFVLASSGGTTKKIPPSTTKKIIMISKEQYSRALQKAQIQDYPDREVFELLYTVMDVECKNIVPCDDLCIGMSVLACPDDIFESILLFAIQVYYHGTRKNTTTFTSKIGQYSIFQQSNDTTTKRSSPLQNIIDDSNNNNTDMISSRDAISILQSLNLMANTLGDKIIEQVQIYKLIDIVFDTISLLDESSQDISYQTFCTNFCKQPIIRTIFYPSPSVLQQQVQQEQSSSRRSPTTHVLTETNHRKSPLQQSGKMKINSNTNPIDRASPSMKNSQHTIIVKNTQHVPLKQGAVTPTGTPVPLSLQTIITVGPNRPSSDVPIILGSSNRNNSFKDDSKINSTTGLLKLTPLYTSIQPQVDLPTTLNKAPIIVMNENYNGFPTAPGLGIQGATSKSASAFATFISTTRQKPMFDSYLTESCDDTNTVFTYPNPEDSEVDDFNYMNNTYYNTTGILKTHPKSSAGSSMNGPRFTGATPSSPKGNNTNSIININTNQNGSGGGNNRTNTYITNAHRITNMAETLAIELPEDETGSTGTPYTLDDLSSRMSKQMKPLAIVQVIHSETE